MLFDFSRGLCRGLVSAILVTVVLILVAACTTVATPPQAGPDLQITSFKPQYARGEPVVLSIILTNRGTSPCRMSGVTDGALTIRSMSRDGSPVLPMLAGADYLDGFEHYVVSNLKNVVAGGSVSLPLVTQPGSAIAGPAGFEMFTGDIFNGADVSSWPVDRPGQYVLTAIYLLPPLADAPADVCRGASGPVSVSFSVLGV